MQVARFVTGKAPLTGGTCMTPPVSLVPASWPCNVRAPLQPDLAQTAPPELCPSRIASQPCPVCVCVCVQIQPSPEYLKAAGLTHLPDWDCRAQAANITVPNLDLGYPEELGGRWGGMRDTSREVAHGCPSCMVCQCAALSLTRAPSRHVCQSVCVCVRVCVCVCVCVSHAGMPAASGATSAVPSSHNSRTTVLVSF